MRLEIESIIINSVDTTNMNWETCCFGYKPSGLIMPQSFIFLVRRFTGNCTLLFVTCYTHITLFLNSSIFNVKHIFTCSITIWAVIFTGVAWMTLELRFLFIPVLIIRGRYSCHLWYLARNRMKHFENDINFAMLFMKKLI